jgi:hypothetical protein
MILTKRTTLLVMLLSLAFMIGTTVNQVARAQNSQAKDKPYLVEYYYKAKWGYADEFIACSRKIIIPS